MKSVSAMIDWTAGMKPSLRGSGMSATGTTPRNAITIDAMGTLVRLSEREAVLQGADGVVRLYLTPDVDKRMIVPAAGNKARKPAQVKETR